MLAGDHQEFCAVSRLEEFAVQCPLTNRWIEKELAKDVVPVIYNRARIMDVPVCLKDYGYIFKCERTKKWYYQVRYYYVFVRTGKDEDGDWIIQTWERDSAEKEDLVETIGWDAYSKAYLNSLTDKQRETLRRGRF